MLWCKQDINIMNKAMLLPFLPITSNFKMAARLQDGLLLGKHYCNNPIQRFGAKRMSFWWIQAKLLLFRQLRVISRWLPKSKMADFWRKNCYNHIWQFIVKRRSFWWIQAKLLPFSTNTSNFKMAAQNQNGRPRQIFLP